jgi:hypothetical protein
MGLTGTDVAIETAEIALLSDDLSKLPHLLGLSRQAMRAIRQNLIFSRREGPGLIAACVYRCRCNGSTPDKHASGIRAGKLELF